MAEEEATGTTFREVYDFFLAGVTDDMFMELTREDTEAMLEEILYAALPHFEFPRFSVDETADGRFSQVLTLEEKMIIRQYMISEWIGYQLASVENVRQKYSSSDFAFTSQATHMTKLLGMKQHYETEGFKLQRLYCRRRKSLDGGYISSMGKIMQKPKE
jgi:hypothetical protein